MYSAHMKVDMDVRVKIEFEKKTLTRVVIGIAATAWR
jgi:hypothetical protein